MFKLGNAYYHLSKACLEQKFGVLFIGNVVAPDTVKVKLAPDHMEIMAQQFIAGC